MTVCKIFYKITQERLLYTSRWKSKRYRGVKCHDVVCVAFGLFADNAVVSGNHMIFSYFATICKNKKNRKKKL